MSLILLHWAVIMGRVSTETGKKCLFAQLDQRSRHRGQLINTICTESRKKDGKNIFSIDKCLDRVFSGPLSKLMRCRCLLKQTRISTVQLSNGRHVCSQTRPP